MARRKQDLADTPKVKVTQESFREAIKSLDFIRPYRWSLIGGMILLFLTSMIFMVMPWLIGQMVDVAQGKAAHTYTLKDIGWGLIVLLVAQGVISYTRVILFANVSEKGTADLRKALYKKMDDDTVATIAQLREEETNAKVRSAMDIVLALDNAKNGESIDSRIASVQFLASSLEPAVRNLMIELSDQVEAPNLAIEARIALNAIEGKFICSR